MHQISDVTSVAIVGLGALACGLLFARLHQPAIIGYIVAGVLLGPTGLGLVKNQDAVKTLADFGVLMLLFLIGMQLDLRRFVVGWRIAAGMVLIQVVGSVGFAMAMSPILGWDVGHAILLGFVVSISSTAVCIKLIEGSDGVSSNMGRTTIGILIGQDVAIVPMMLILGSLSSKDFDYFSLGKIGFSVFFLVALFWFLLRKPVHFPFGKILSTHDDLAPLTGLVWCFGAATIAELAGLSGAYGAFLAGVVIGNSSNRQSMLRSSQPIEAVLMMVFFLSIGLLLDISFIWENLGMVALLLLMVTVFKTLLNFGGLRMLGESKEQSILIGFTLAQIGEFSFVLAGIGISKKLIGADEGRVIVAVTVLSLMLSPLWMALARRLTAVKSADHPKRDYFAFLHSEKEEYLEIEAGLDDRGLEEPEETPIFDEPDEEEAPPEPPVPEKKKLFPPDPSFRMEEKGLPPGPIVQTQTEESLSDPASQTEEDESAPRPTRESEIAARSDPRSDE